MMAKYQLTNKAEAEIEEVFEYSIVNFGLKIAREYVTGLHEKLKILAKNQSWGSGYGFIRPELYRYEYRSHSIYYKSSGEDILIIRVLGNRQDPAQHF